MPGSMHDGFTQITDLPMVMTPAMASGKTYIVTGSNGGLGYEAAKHLVSMGAAKVVMAVRTVSKGETAQQEIEAATGRKGVIEVWALDKSSFDSVKAFANKAIDELDHVDALIDNAGVAQSATDKVENHNENLTVNTYSSLLLAVLFLPSMSTFAKKSGTTPVITLVSSGSSFSIGSEWNKVKDAIDPLVKMEDAKVIAPPNLYPLSKAVQIMATKHLARQIPVSRTGVVLNLVDPGICMTSLSRHAPEEFRKELAEVHKATGRTAEEGSRTLLHGAVAGEASHGCLLDSCTVNEDLIPAWIDGPQAKSHQKTLWESIAQELERASPGCVEAIV